MNAADHPPCAIDNLLTRRACAGLNPFASRADHSALNGDATALRTVVIDDEPSARDRLVDLLRGERGVTVLAECGCGTSAAAAIAAHEPELVFLDIDLPECDGFDLLAATQQRHGYDAIVMTAQMEHAVRAFELHALDFLLKPFEVGRLRRAVQRAHDHRRGAGSDGRGENAAQPVATWDRIAIREHNRVIFVRPAEIDWVEAEGNYVRLHLGARAHMLRQSMRAAEQRLASRGFLRISRSVLVNLERVRELQPLFHGDSVLVLHDGRQLTATRAYRAQLDDMLLRLV